MGFQMQISSIIFLRFSWSILVKCYVHLQRSSSKTQMLLVERNSTINIDCFVLDSSRFYLTFAAFCLFSVICKQQLKQWNQSVTQSALMCGFQTDFTSSVWNFGHCIADIPPRKTSPAAGRNSCFRRLKFSRLIMNFFKITVSQK